ncbi:MAG: endonuclease/exonuclease/phosphatase family protein [Lacibacter sp.]
MKKIRSFIIVFGLLLFSAGIKSQHITVGTFNLRYDNANDTGNLWKDRLPVVSSLIRFHAFDIVGTQEGLKNQLADLSASLPGFAYYGVGRDDARSGGEHSAIFYKTDKYSLIGSGDFWLSETPEKPGFGWDARNNRICSWIQLKEKNTGNVFFVFNVHYDHRGVAARIESSKLIMTRIQVIAGKHPVILTGDFNGNHQSEWYRYIQGSGLLKDALTMATDPYINNGSFNSFKTNNPAKDIIDHIFLSEQFRVIRFGILTDTYHGKFPSDHYPVLAEAELR